MSVRQRPTAVISAKKQGPGSIKEEPDPPCGAGRLKVSGLPGSGLGATRFQIWRHLTKFQHLLCGARASAARSAHVRTRGLQPGARLVTRRLGDVTRSAVSPAHEGSRPALWTFHIELGSCAHPQPDFLPAHHTPSARGHRPASVGRRAACRRAERPELIIMVPLRWWTSAASREDDGLKPRQAPHLVREVSKGPGPSTEPGAGNAPCGGPVSCCCCDSDANMEAENTGLL